MNLRECKDESDQYTQYGLMVRTPKDEFEARIVKISTQEESFFRVNRVIMKRVHPLRKRKAPAQSISFLLQAQLQPGPFFLFSLVLSFTFFMCFHL